MKSLFGIMVMVGFQNAIRLEIYKNNFLKKKIIFDINIFKQYKNIKKLI